MSEVITFDRNGVSSVATKSVAPQSAYVEPIKEMLGDKHLNPEEAVHREREELLKICARKKIWGQDELEDRDRSSGRRMPWTEVVGRLLRCNPGIKVRDGAPGSIALYFHKRHEDYKESDFDYASRPKDDFYIHHKYVGGFEMHPMPEYSSIEIDSSHLPTREFRSWRSVLIGLIKARVITYASAIEHFGDPAGDRRSNRWFEQLQEYR